ncbi:MAG: Mrp/NBP35 family ATP-binding protein [Clostridia bacterium]|nr:Mrp/NBP35 family ATP-binding protein [Clostridia bacterium]MBQ9994044.1 Mrp/NBP35 family ATP-binding protein [Clostridia bacterium]
MSESCTHDCSTCSANCSSREGAQQPQFAQLNELSKVKKVVAVASGKGGVGKSLVTSLLGVMMQRRGYRVAILDADITGPSIPKAFGINERAQGNENLIFPVESKTGISVMSVNLLLENASDPVVWRGPVLAGVVQQFWSDVVWNDIDVLLIDMPPGTGDVPLTVFQSIPVDGLITVTSPQSLVSMVVAKAVKMAELMNIPMLGIVENMSYTKCPDCGKEIKVYGDSHIEEIAKEHNLELLGRLPIDIKLAAACDAGMIELFEGDWLEAAANAIEGIL